MNSIDFGDSDDDNDDGEFDLNTLAVDHDSFMFALKNINPINQIDRNNQEENRCNSRCGSKCGQRKTDIKWLNH